MCAKSSSAQAHCAALRPSLRVPAGLRCQLLASPTQPSYDPNVDPLRFVYWQDGAFWLGYIEEFPDYLTQGESFEDLKAHLRDLYADINGGHIPAVRRTAALDVA